MATTHLYKHYNSSLEKANVFGQRGGGCGARGDAAADAFLLFGFMELINVS